MSVWPISSIKRLVRRGLESRIDKRLRTFRSPYIKRKCIEGVCFDFYIGDQDGMSWYDTDSTDPFWPEMRLIKEKLINPGDVILEAGGHQGCTGILLANWVGPAGKVVSFEPNPRNFDIYIVNKSINNLPSLSVENVAVGDRRGKAVISTGRSNSSLVSPGSGSASVEVDMVTLDDYLHLKPTLIKIDVEGADILVLRGARSLLKTRPKLAIEIHRDSLSRYGTALEELFELIDFSGYDCWVQWEYEPDIHEWDFGSKSSRDTAMERIVHGTHLFARPKRQPPHA
jgi:FkbM family methyltransferase